MSLSFDLLRQANRTRLPLFKNKHGDTAHIHSDGSDWDFATWLMATMGELGELAEVRIAYERGEIETAVYEQAISSELADVATYLDLLANRALDESGSDRSKLNSDDPWILMELLVAIGLFANDAKKAMRGDFGPEEYRSKKVKHLIRAQCALTLLMRSASLRPSINQNAHPTGVDLGEAIVAKFNEVSDRVKAPVKIEHWRSKSSHEEGYTVVVKE